MEYEHKTRSAIAMAILAAALYGISAPLAKLLLVEIHPTLMAALLYLGAGLGMLAVNLSLHVSRRQRLEAPMTSAEIPYIFGMVVLDIAAPILLMLGLTLTTAENVSLLNNFEIVATSLMARLLFHEAVGRRMWIAIGLITFASIILSLADMNRVSFSAGSLLVVAACLCWGLENNITRMLSLKDPGQIVVVKGIGSGLGSLLIAWKLHALSHAFLYMAAALVLGFVAYGLSIFFYVSAQRQLGAARTSAYYAAAPFIGVLFSWLILREEITTSFSAALFIMLIGTYFAVSEHHAHSHMHQEITHEHKHSHADEHHHHPHSPMMEGAHSHAHTHPATEHAHPHTPDLHHRHQH